MTNYTIRYQNIKLAHNELCIFLCGPHKLPAEWEYCYNECRNGMAQSFSGVLDSSTL